MNESSITDLENVCLEQPNAHKTSTRLQHPNSRITFSESRGMAAKSLKI
jgi:hypothetical protein